MTIGEMCRLMLTRSIIAFVYYNKPFPNVIHLLTVFRLEWFDTRFPRIAVNFEVFADEAICFQVKFQKLVFRSKSAKTWMLASVSSRSGITSIISKGSLRYVQNIFNFFLQSSFETFYENVNSQKPDHGSPGGRSAGRASRDRDSKTRERFGLLIKSAC